MDRDEPVSFHSPRETKPQKIPLSECSGNVTTGQENSNGLFLLNIGFYSANGLHYPTLLILTADIILKEVN